MHLYVGKTTAIIHRDDLKYGLLAATKITKGTVLCINTTGISLGGDETFWDYSDYDVSQIRIALHRLENKVILINQNDSRPNYVNYAQDPLDPSLVNAQLEYDPCGLFILTCIKDCIVGDEIFISFALASWLTYFRNNWSNDNFISNSVVMKKAREVYCIDDELGRKVSKSFSICKTIENKLEECYTWKNGIKYPLKHYINQRGSSYINAFFQCISHIPALTRIILETNTFDEMIPNPRKNDLSQYIVRIMMNNDTLEDNDNNDTYIHDNDLISSNQNLGFEMIGYFLTEFPTLNSTYETVKHHLFEFYYDEDIYCIEQSHHMYQ